jgi:SAM-dependent methyltransferase
MAKSQNGGTPLVGSIPPLTTAAWLRFDIIREALRAAAPSSVLEFGPGSGALASWMARRFDYTGVEPNAESRARTQARLQEAGSGEVLASVEQLGQRQFDAVCAFEVLEHIEDDVRALEQWRSFLHPAGTLLLSVPAHSRRFGAHDELSGHLRRYDRPDLMTRLNDAGLQVSGIYSCGVASGQVLEALRNVRARRHGVAGSVEERTSVSGHLFQTERRGAPLVYAAVAAPLRVLQRPFRATDAGIGYVAVARPAL